ncbi:hypothetical protein [Rhizobium oryzicola]|uniref:Uncharacterized protein n=1 Tax=Rhizobium oryzicola TaxID=1232668 RepID=A0ABT8SZM0_9HYPH|nr:hypothetical protein [Rhizobium oryzicola]MDO1583812.1 hypothetical protein [Rhizobium oryzicola]
MTPFSLPHLGIFDFLTFRTLKLSGAKKSYKPEAAPIVMSNPDEREESSQIYLWSFFPLF